MMKYIAEASHEETGVIKYYLVKNDCHEGTAPAFGVALEQGNSLFEVSRVDTDEKRLEDFIRKMAEGIVTPITFYDVCDDYSTEVNGG